MILESTPEGDSTADQAGSGEKNVEVHVTPQHARQAAEDLALLEQQKAADAEKAANMTNFQRDVVDFHGPKGERPGHVLGAFTTAVQRLVARLGGKR